MRPQRAGWTSDSGGAEHPLPAQSQRQDLGPGTRGAPLTVLGKTGEWFLVRYNDIQGYAKEDYVTLV